MYRRILVPVDFSEHGQRAMDHAVALARAVGAEVVLFHAFERPTPPKVPATDAKLRAYLAEAVAEARARLEHLAAAQEGVTVRALTVEGRPADEILAALRDEDCDLVCMGSHGRGALREVLMGSVTERVLHHAPCPVLVVRPPARGAAAGDDGEDAG